MPKIYKRKTNREEISEMSLKKALKGIKSGKKTYRSASSEYGIKKSTLFKRMKAFKKAGGLINGNDSGNSDGDDSSIGRVPNGRTKYKHRQIFTNKEEDQLCDYLQNSSRIFYGLTYDQFRKLAYDFLKQLKKPHRSAWEKHKMASKDWLLGFMARHPMLSLRKPENTSISRATSFNSTNVNEFFENYKSVLTRYKFKSSDIYNLDESGIQTVLQSPKVWFKIKTFFNILNYFIKLCL